MRLKSYFASSIEEAIGRARQELGGEAMLVNSRGALPEARHLGAYEVVFAAPSCESGAAVPSTAQESTAASKPATSAPPWERITRELAELRQQVERTALAIARTPQYPTAPVPLALPRQETLTAQLVEAGADSLLARDIATRAVLSLRAPSRDAEATTMDLSRAAADEIIRAVAVDPSLGRTGAQVRVAALVGPPGAGKTTTLVKLAARYGLPARRGVQILSMDTFRVAAADQLRRLAAILGTGFQILETPRTLEQAIEEHRSKDLILIDTPGLGPRDMDAGADLADFLARSERVDTHLVLTANSKTADLADVAQRFALFRPAKLLFTRLDETTRLGSIWSLAARTGLPVSFLSCGQQIPEDLEEASVERIAEWAFGAPAEVVRPLTAVGGAAAA